MAGVELRGAQFGMAFKIEPARLHEAERLIDALGELRVASRLRAVLDRAQHPLLNAGEIGIAALRKSAQQIERRRRLPIGLKLTARVRDARLRRELGAVDDVAAIDRKLDAVLLLHRRRARLGELPGDAADLHHRRRCRIGQHHGHLQEDAEEVANVVGAMLGEAFRAIAALQQKRLAGGDPPELLGQVARLTGKNQRRKARELALDLGKRLLVRVVGHLQCRLLAPAVGRPTLGHGDLLGGSAANFPAACRTYIRQRTLIASRMSGQRHSAAWRSKLNAFSRRVTSSSAAVGCTAITASKSALVAFIFTAMPITWISSPASGPTMWQPTT